MHNIMQQISQTLERFTFLYRGQWTCSDSLLSVTGTFTVYDALEAIGFGKFQWKICLLTGLSWVSILKQAEMSSLWFPDTVRRSCSALSLWEQIGDSMEMMILSILGPQLHCEWRLPSYKVALITSVRSSQTGCTLQLVDLDMCEHFVFFFWPQVVFVGMGLSSPIWGNVSDKYGRRVVSVTSGFFTLYSLVIFVHYLMFNTCIFCMCLFCKQGLMICMCWTLYYGLLSSFSPVYGWLLVLRGLVGFGIGGAPQS